MKRLISGALMAALTIGISAPGALARSLSVVAATPELADIAREVGGSKVSVHSVARPNQDYHHVEARPTDVAALHSADLFVRIGMDFDLWADALMQAAKNPKVAKGGAGYVDASEGVTRLEVPVHQITGASGDIHVYGNPHYYNDPVYGKRIAYNILLGLRKVDPGSAAAYDAGYKAFAAKIDAAMPRWKRELAGAVGKPVVTYHKDLDYFMRRFGIGDFGNLEPKPGIPPSPAHVSALIREMKAHNVKAVVVQSVYPMRYPAMIARETGAHVEEAPYSIGTMGTRSYIEFIDKIVDAYRKACQ